MPDDDIVRRLTTILAADVVGYSRQMSSDEVDTLRRLRKLRNEAIDPAISKYEGRIFKTMGDGLLVEYSSTVNAVMCAAEIQATLETRNANLPDGETMRLRIGINLGDVIIDGNDIFGHGVNIAARIESVAEPDGVSVSGVVYDQVVDKVEFRFSEGNETPLKNIDKPIRVYQLDMDSVRKIQRSETEQNAAELEVGNKPSIAVLAFDNMSGDPDREYFADGLTEEIITALSCWQLFPVISRNSSFAFKGHQLTIAQVSHQLGARYIVEGSVRTSGDHVRISAQLIDAETDHHLWAERYDRELSDVFAVQEEIAFRIASAIEPAAIQSAAAKLLRRSSNTDAWDCALRGWWHLWKFNKKAFAEARKWFQQSIERDSTWSVGHSGLAAAKMFALFLENRSLESEELSDVESDARRAIAIDPSDAIAHIAVGACASYRLDIDAALESVNRALKLNPSFAMAHYTKGTILIYGGQPKIGLQSIRNAIQLSPHDLYLSGWLLDTGMAYYFLGRYEQSVAECKKVLQLQPRWTAAMALNAASLSRLGNRHEAGELFAQVKVLIPDFRLEGLRAAFQFRESDFEMFVDDLRAAGWG